MKSKYYHRERWMGCGVIYCLRTKYPTADEFKGLAGTPAVKILNQFGKIITVITDKQLDNIRREVLGEYHPANEGIGYARNTVR